MCIFYIMIWVGNIDCLIDFYIWVLGMILFRKNDYFDGQFIFVFVGYGNEVDFVVIEFIYNWGVDVYEIGIGYGYIVIEVDDVYQVCDDICNNGGQVICEVGLMKYGIIVIVFVIDLDGYKIELIQKFF